METGYSVKNIEQKNGYFYSHNFMKTSLGITDNMGKYQY